MILKIQSNGSEPLKRGTSSFMRWGLDGVAVAFAVGLGKVEEEEGV